MLWLMIISGTETGSLTGLRCTGLACKYNYSLYLSVIANGIIIANINLLQIP